MKSMKWYYLSLLIFSTLKADLAFTQVSTPPLPRMNTNTEKWCRAIINLETRNSAVRDAKLDAEMSEKWQKGQISGQQYQEYIEEAEKVARNEATAGTAIFLKYNNRHYFLTARHVVEGRADARDPDPIKDKIMVIQNSSHVTDPKYIDNELLFLLNVGTRMFEFTSKEHDLALISVDIRGGKEFLETLERRGYRPIEIVDIDLECQLQAGQMITCFGFPGDLYLDGVRTVSAQEVDWKSRLLTIPVISKGVVVNPLPGNYYFSGGIYVTHGNSGGPIVVDNKLVGIVSRQSTQLELTEMPSFSYYKYRDLQFIKSSLIKPLLDTLEERVIYYEDLRK